MEGDEKMKKKSLHQDVYISLAVYMLVGLLLLKSVGMNEQSAIFPRMILIGLALLNTAVFIRGLKNTRVLNESDQGVINHIRWEVIKAPLAVFLITAVYALIFSLTNYFVATTIFIVGLMKFYKVKSWKTILLLTVIFNAAIYVGFVMGLKVPLI